MCTLLDRITRNTYVDRYGLLLYRLSSVVRRCVTLVSPAKAAEPIEMPFGFWTRMGRRKHKFNRICQVVPMCPQGRARIVLNRQLRRRCGLLTNYFDHLLLWPPCVADADIIFLSCGFFLLSSFFRLFSAPILSRRRLDVYRTSTHGVALV